MCINKATRLASYFASLDKEYRAVMKLGEVTDTQDAEGSVIEKSDSISVAESLIKNTLKSFEGEILQTPPMYSALKHKGKPLYKYAKKGIDIPVEPRKVYIHRIEVLNIELPFVAFTAACSKGTYLRTLCHDAGKKIGIGAHLYELERTAVGPFSINDSLSVEELNSISPDSPSAKGIYTPDRALSWIPELKIGKPLINAVRNGAPVRIKDCPGFPRGTRTITEVKIKSPEGKFLAVGRLIPGKGIVKMDVVMGCR